MTNKNPKSRIKTRRFSAKRKRKECRPDQIRNPESTRCVLRNGRIGKNILKKSRIKRQKISKPNKPNKTKERKSKKITKKCRKGYLKNPKNEKCVSSN